MPFDLFSIIHPQRKMLVECGSLVYYSVLKFVLPAISVIMNAFFMKINIELKRVFDLNNRLGCWKCEVYRVAN